MKKNITTNVLYVFVIIIPFSSRSIDKRSRITSNGWVTDVAVRPAIAPHNRRWETDICCLLYYE